MSMGLTGRIRHLLLCYQHIFPYQFEFKFTKLGKRAIINIEKLGMDPITEQSKLLNDHGERS